MNEIIQGDKIFSNSSKSFHIVDGVEIIEGFTLVFTEDVKCFPINDVRKCINSWSDFLEKKMNDEKIDEVEYNSFIKDMALKMEKEFGPIRINF
jgi:hypothetical protein